MAQSTTDYKQFKILKGNREVNRQHVTKLAKSIALNPELLQARPILVNDKMEIIDGQHRFTACKEMGVPVWYEIVRDLSTEDAIALNRNQRNWGVVDFAKSYAANGNTHYARFNELKEQFPHLTPSTLITYLQGGGQKGQASNFREGKFEITDEAEAVKYLSLLEELFEINPYMNLTTVAQAMLQVFKSPNYDHKRMLKKLMQYGDAQFNPYGSKSDILRSIENLYNFHQTEVGVSRLY